MKTIIQAILTKWQDPLDVLRECGGYYECPKGADGKRLGPLVGYAGRDELDRQFVGDVYVNFAKAERHAQILRHFARRIETVLVGTTGELLQLLQESTGFCGAPEGGKALAVTLANIFDKQYIFPEKKITAVATTTSREVSNLAFDRHEPDGGDKWWIVEDVCNNFSTTTRLVGLIENFGAEVMGIICFLNRSLDIGDSFTVREGLVLPIISIVRKPIAQYRQDDPAVVDDVSAGNVVWKPKNDWRRLAEAMAHHQT
jgi:adenine/guanine phosphoribosyltransferase-like PRPP-binding protein